jgi:membrane-bound metal-dependent hydrolase YbcI (DUF457 family)
MYIITHTLAPVVLIATADLALGLIRKERPLKARHYAAIALAGALPDLLWPHMTLAARYASWTHTVWCLVLFALVAAWGARYLFSDRARMMTALMIGAYGLHLFCDAIAGGIAWGYPFTDRIVGQYYVQPSIWYELDVGMTLLACVVLSLLVLRSPRRNETRPFGQETG